jgi:hypothetical protein
MTDAVRSCRVCGCTEDRACEGGCSWLPIPHDSLCSACAPAQAHVVSMTIDDRGRSVATCECGWTENAIRTTGGRMVLDKRIKRHWQDVVARAVQA